MTLALVDNRISDECERALMIRGFRVIRMPASKNLPTPMASHPDMLVFYHKGHLISTADYGEEAEYVFSDVRYDCDISMKFVGSMHGKKYPADAIFNALVIGNKIFCKTDSIDPAVLEYAKSAGLLPIHVNQGYPACTVLALSAEHAITADRGMAAAMQKEGIKVTLIDDGDISLPPYEYGFIGGAAGAYGDKVYFLGNARLHKSYPLIEKAIADAGMSAVFLAPTPLADLGRIIFIPEHSDNND